LLLFGLVLMCFFVNCVCCIVFWYGYTPLRRTLASSVQSEYVNKGMQAVTLCSSIILQYSTQVDLDNDRKMVVVFSHLPTV